MIRAAIRDLRQMGQPRPAFGRASRMRRYLSLIRFIDLTAISVVRSPLPVKALLASQPGDDERLDNQLQARGLSLRVVVKEIPPVFGSFF